MKKGIVYGIVVVLVVVIGVLGYKNHATKQTTDENTIKIGVILPLTGPISELGKNALIALKIAETEINKNSKTDNLKVEIIVEDGKYTSKDSISAYQKLKLAKVKALIVLGDVPNYSLAPLINEDEIPTIAYVATAQNIPELSPWMFRGWYSTDAASRGIAEFLKLHNATDISMLSILNNFGDEFTKSLKTELSSVGGDIQNVETFDMSSLDNRSLIQKSLTSSPKAIAVIGFGPAYISIFNQLQEVEYKGLLVTETSIVQKYYVSNIRNVQKNIYYVDTKIDITKDENHFTSSFKEQTNSDPDIFSAFGYINLYILKNAIAKNGTSAEQIRKGLLEMKNYQSIVGPLSYSDNGELSVDLTVRKLK